MNPEEKHQSLQLEDLSILLFLESEFYEACQIFLPRLLISTYNQESYNWGALGVENWPEKNKENYYWYYSSFSEDK